MYNWSVTQTLTLTEQLEAGIRYFDFGVARKPGILDPFFLHNLYGKRVSDSMQEINLYLREHPKEVVLLDFNHFYDMNLLDHHALLRMLMRIFDQKICPVNKIGLDFLTLRNMWQASMQVIIFYHDDDKIHNLPHFWPGSSIPSSWEHSSNTYRIINFLNKNLKAGRPSNGFHVSECVCKPNTSFVEHRIESSLKEAVAKPSAFPFISWIKRQHTGDANGVNIVIMDFVEQRDFITDVIQLNYSDSKQGNYKR